MIALRNILVATDFSEASEAALLYGQAIARQFGATLHVFHALDNVFMRAIMADPHVVRASVTRRLQERLGEDRGVLAGHAIVEVSDHPADSIVAYARAAEVDLIITGTHGRTGLAHALIGSVAEQIVRRASCPVLTVRHPEREFVTVDSARTRRTMLTAE